MSMGNLGLSLTLLNRCKIRRRFGAKALSELIVAVCYRKKNIRLNEYGERIGSVSEGDTATLTLDYTLPQLISKTLSYRFTDVATKGVRTATGRQVFAFRYEANDSYTVERGMLSFDVEPFSNPNEVTMLISFGEKFGGGLPFQTGKFAQGVINTAIRKATGRREHDFIW